MSTSKENNVSVTKRVLVTVKTYPQLSEKQIETVCTVGLTEEGKWIRLYPIPFRYLKYSQWFSKYQWIRVALTKLESDPRPETFRPDLTTLQTLEMLDTKNNWLERRKLVLPHVIPSIEYLKSKRESAGMSFGIVPVSQTPTLIIDKLEGSPPARQLRLFEQIKDLDYIPYNFRYQFRCEGERCSGHNMSILDWEIYALFRTLQERGDSTQTILEKIEQKFIGEFFSRDKNTFLYIGNNRFHPVSFMVLGVFRFKREE